MIFEFLNDINVSNSSNHKLSVLEKYKNNDEIKKFLTLVYDKINYSYSIKKIPEYDVHKGQHKKSIFEISVLFEELNNRTYTGNAAISRVRDLLESVEHETQHIIKCIIDRDIHSGVSTKQINKIFKNLLPSFPYMRCSLIDKLNRITYPAFVQIKMDGTYRTFVKKGLDIKSYSRDGREYIHPIINSQLLNLPDGAYIGELLCNNIEGVNSTEIRYKSNGLLNSLTPPDDVTFYMWDYLSNDEFISSSTNTPYKSRFEILCKLLNEKVFKNLAVVETEIVENYEGALNKLNYWLNSGEEGAILKNISMGFKNGTSTDQIKLKPEIEIEVRCVGFTRGNGKYVDTFGAIEFKTDDDLIKGQVSGLNDDERKHIHANISKYLNKVFTIKATAITKAKDKDYYALMHPRFKEFREDKDYTDTLNRIQSMGMI